MHSRVTESKALADLRRQHNLSVDPVEVGWLRGLKQGGGVTQQVRERATCLGIVGRATGLRLEQRRDGAAGELDGLGIGETRGLGVDSARPQSDGTYPSALAGERHGQRSATAAGGNPGNHTVNVCDE